MTFFSQWKPFSRRGEMYLSYRSAQSCPDGEDGLGNPKSIIYPERLRVLVVERLYIFGVCFATRPVVLPLVQEIHDGQFWPEVEELKKFVAKHYAWGSQYLEGALADIRSSQKLVSSSACCVMELTGQK